MRLFLLYCLFFTLTVTTSCGHSRKTTASAVSQKTVLSDTAVSTWQEPAKTDNFLENILKSHPQYFDSILLNKKELRVQIIYTQINRNRKNQPSFKQYFFNVNAGNYFYPASTVKMPVALLALQKLNEMKITGVDKNTSFITETAFEGETPVYNDPTSPDGRPTIANYVKKIFLVSDNDAYNRLYEFLGQEYINTHLLSMGFGSACIVHRLEVNMNEEQHRTTNPVKFFDSTAKLLHWQPLQRSNFVYPGRHDWIAKAFFSNGILTQGPMNFSRKNRISLEDLTKILQSVLFPEAVPVNQRFNLSSDDYKLVRQYMSQFPGETNFPEYDTAEFHDAYAKLLKYGSAKGSLPKHIRIFNKEGDAYGFLTDIAYIVDFDKNIEFMLSATIYCNGDGVMNDDHYDYDTIGLPFLKHLGEVMYDYELQRKRKRTPDLSAFKMVYDK